MIAVVFLGVQTKVLLHDRYEGSVKLQIDYSQVNMASRMESSGEPGKIQLSQQSKDLLDNDYPEFITTKRGEVEIKVIFMTSKISKRICSKIKLGFISATAAQSWGK